MNKFFILLFLITNSFNNIYSQKTIEMKKINGIYQIPCKVNGIPMNFVFDTGASDVTISVTEAKFLLKQGLLEKVDFIENVNYKMANGEIIEGTKINLKTVEIGGFLLKNISASVIYKQNAPLLLGQSALSKLGQYSINGNQLIISTSDIDDAIICGFKDFLPFKIGDTKFDIINTINKSNKKIFYPSSEWNSNYNGTYTALTDYSYLKTQLNKTIINLNNKTLCTNSLDNRIQLYLINDYLYKAVIEIQFDVNQYNEMMTTYDHIIELIPDVYKYKVGFSSTNDLKEKVGEGAWFYCQPKEKRDNIKINELEVSYEMEYEWDYKTSKPKTNVKYYNIKIQIVDLRNTKLTNKGY